MDLSGSLDRGTSLTMGRDDSVTELLLRASRGEQDAADELFSVVYERLRRQADRFMREQAPSHTLQATALVHEMYVRLFGSGGTAWEDRRHFLSVASRAMRSILVDYARRKGRKKRTPGGARVPLEAIGVNLGDRTVDVLDLDEALTDLAREDERAARVVECRFFGQYTMSEISLLLDVPKRTVERDWTFARLWLKRYLDR